MDVVENIRNIAIGQGGLRRGRREWGKRFFGVLSCPRAGYRSSRRRRRSALNDAEFRDALRLALVEEPKVSLAQISDSAAFAVAHHYRHGNQIHPAGERHRGLV
jgi:hypothetical protein